MKAVRRDRSGNDKVKLENVFPVDAELEEIPEDAYKQNNVYRPWRPGVARERSKPRELALDEVS
jgi:hypothetical protein